MFLGGLLFASGFTGILALICISIFKPWNYNGIQGFRSFLLGSDTELFFTIYCILGVLGIVICSIEAYRKK
jgi:hypothetical protein